MSVQDASQTSTLPSTLKSEAKPKPELPPKPATQASSPPLGDRGSCTRLSGGKVKRIVHKFSKQESVPAEQPTNGTTKQVRRPPSTMPKPGRQSLQLQVNEEQAPPLPMKRSRFLKTQRDSEGGDEGDDITMEGSRSAPDGKEVEVQLIGGGEEEAEHSPDEPPRSCCDPHCSCVCHVQRPGMRLMWVPVDVEDIGQEVIEENEPDVDDEKGEVRENGEDWEVYDDVEPGGEEDTQVGEEDGSSEVDESEVVNQEKEKFNQSLDVLIGEGYRRRSDPGPHCVLSSLTDTRSQSPPVPPKRTKSPSVSQSTSQDEEDNIYETTLLVVPATKNASALCKELDIPLIKVRKPARRSKLTYSTSDPTSEFQMDDEPAPPAIPPRMPIITDNRSLMLALRGAIPLPQPTLEEWRALRPSSPNRLSPQRAMTPPPASQLVPQRPPPPPPKTDPRRHSSASLQTFPQKKGLPCIKIR